MEKQYDIILLQEPHSINNKVDSFGLTARIVAHEGERPWAALVVLNPEITVVKLTHLCTSHFAIAEVSLGDSKLYVASGYFQLSHDINTHLDHLESVVRALRGKRLLIGLDANAKSPLWGLCERDESGEALEDFLLQWDLRILNDRDGGPTTSNVRGEGYPDVTLASASLEPYIIGWKVHEAWTSSDHNAITMKYVSERPSNDNDLELEGDCWRGYVTSKANWDTFTDKLESEWREAPMNALGSKRGVIETVRYLTQSLRRACHASMPRRQKSGRKVPWWNPALTQIKKTVYAARRLCQREKDPVRRNALLQEYRTQRKAYGKQIARTRREKWSEYVTAESRKNPWGLPYKVGTGKLKVQEVASNVKVNDTYTTDWESTAKAVLECLFKWDTDEDETDWQRGIRASIKSSPDGRTPPFTRAEMDAAIDKMKAKKAPGPDNFDLTIIKAALPVIGDDLLKIYNACREHAIFPNEWKVGKVVTIRKSPEKDPTDPASYRPICLLPILGKLLEALILTKLNEIMGDRLSDRQFGFRRGRSTEDAIARFRDSVDSRDQKYVIAIFLDIKGAFDNVWWPSVLHALKTKGCPRQLYKLVANYLNERKVLIRDGSNQVERMVNKGCPQGSVLGPTLWNLIFDSNLESLEAIDCESLAYADDEVIIVKGNSTRELREKSQSALDTVIEWCKEHKLELSPTKCVWMAIGGKPDRASVPIKINGHLLKKVKETKYLGVTFNEGVPSKGVQVTSHVRSVCDKARIMFNNLGRLARDEWGLGYGAFNTIYKGLFVPITTYAAVGWADKLLYRDKRYLVSAQRYALMRVSNSWRTASADSMPVLTGNLPILMECQRRAGSYRLRRGQSFRLENYVFHGRELSKQELTAERKTLFDTLVANWQSEWNESDKGRNTYEFLPDVKKRLKSPWIQLDRWVTQVITGHGWFNAFRHRQHMSETDECSCGAMETRDHVLYRCEKYNNIRQKIHDHLGTGDFVAPALLEKGNFGIFAKFARELMETKDLTEALEEELALTTPAE